MRIGKIYHPILFLSAIQRAYPRVAVEAHGTMCKPQSWNLDVLSAHCLLPIVIIE